MTDSPRVTGVVLAAGAGTRFGGPKALARDPGGTPWMAQAVRALEDGGCTDVLVVLGAEADRAVGLLPSSARVVVAHDWAGGLSRSLAAALDAAAGADAVLVVPVDTPGLPAAAVQRIRDAAGSAPRAALVRAVYDDRPGHPVLLGAEHWPSLRGELAGDVGAGPFLARRSATPVECGDLWSGADRDTQ